MLIIYKYCVFVQQLLFDEVKIVFLWFAQRLTTPDSGQFQAVLIKNNTICTISFFVYCIRLFYAKYFFNKTAPSCYINKPHTKLFMIFTYISTYRFTSSHGIRAPFWHQSIKSNCILNTLVCIAIDVNKDFFH